jgi:hypothetical protein
MTTFAAGMALAVHQLGIGITPITPVISGAQFAGLPFNPSPTRQNQSANFPVAAAYLFCWSCAGRGIDAPGLLEWLGFLSHGE